MSQAEKQAKVSTIRFQREDRVHFAIRDDDINFFTKPKEIEEIYSGVWDTCPISLSITPFQRGCPEWLFPDCPRDSDEEFPLGTNEDLVTFLRDGCARGRLSVLMHGYNHDIPSGQPEFWAGGGLYEKAKKGKAYLESVLGTRITCFVPPHNALSREGIEAVVDAGMDIVGIQSFRPDKRVPRLQNIIPFLIRNWYLRILREEYPRPLWVANHWEIPYSTLGALASPDSLQTGIRRAIQRGGSFCFSTHYWEFKKRMKSKSSMTLQDLFLELFELARNATNAAFTTVDKLPRVCSGESTPEPHAKVNNCAPL
jgi:hypothetical protein